MAMFGRLARRVEIHAATAIDRMLDAVEVVAVEFPDIMLHREGDQLVMSGRGLLWRWLSDVRLRFAYWRGK